MGRASPGVTSFGPVLDFRSHWSDRAWCFNIWVGLDYVIESPMPGLGAPVAWWL